MLTTAKFHHNPTPLPPPDIVELRMDRDTALTLLAVTYRIAGGCLPRARMESIRKALEQDGHLTREMCDSVVSCGPTDNSLTLWLPGQSR